MKAFCNEKTSAAFVGVGLRDPHYSQIFQRLNSIDFVEVHAENFFVEGGPALAMLQQVRESVDVSLHATSLGLGSEGYLTIPDLRCLKRLVDAINPRFVSDHACFCWTRNRDEFIHSGDLLPIAHNDRTLKYFSENVDFVQQFLGRKLIIENVSSYLTMPDNTMREFEFLQKLCARSGAGLLLDINNIYVNVVNADSPNPLAATLNILSGVDGSFVEEIHLAGSTPPREGEMLIDDHGAKVSEPVWQAYRYAIERMGTKPTLIEWDTQLPSLAALLEQSDRARHEVEQCYE